MSSADPKPKKRVRDRELMKQLHLDRGVCCLCENYHPSSHLHHVYPRGQGGDDVRENLVFLCFRCHDRIHANDTQKCAELGQFLARERQDVLSYIDQKLGHPASDMWMVKHLCLHSDEADRLLAERYGDEDGVVWWNRGGPVDRTA